MKRFVLGIALLAVVGILIWQIVKHINEPNSKLLTDLYYKYVPTWHRVLDASLGDGTEISSSISNIRLYMYDILYENVELQNKDLLDKIREFIWFSGKSDLNILLEQGKVSEVIDELDKLGFRINLGLYNEICLNTPLDQQTDQMKNFMKVFADSQKLDGLDVGAVNRNEVYVALFVSLAILSFIGACAAIATSIVHKRTPVNFILDPQNYGICSMKFGNCDLCGM